MDKCNEIKQHPHPYGREAQIVFSFFVGDCRAHLLGLLEIDPSLRSSGIPGDRFRSDNIVWATLRSGYTEQEFLQDAERAVTDALLACARRDHWYQFEKQWD